MMLPKYEIGHYISELNIQGAYFCCEGLGHAGTFLRLPKRRHHHDSSRHTFLDYCSVLSEYTFIPFNSKVCSRICRFMNCRRCFCRWRCTCTILTFSLSLVCNVEPSIWKRLGQSPPSCSLLKSMHWCEQHWDKLTVRRRIAPSGSRGCP